jgi:hexosaminidase
LSTANKIIVGGKTEAGTFYGLQTLKQLMRGDGANAYVQGARIVDYPTMRYRAFSDDVSRGLVPTVDYVKRQIRTFAMFKMNMHSLYMEHTFASESHPLFAPEEGSFTPEEFGKSSLTPKISRRNRAASSRLSGICTKF